ncbi:MAG: NAD(P)H-dependent glycerol-3-phosphate dehydrogenase [Bacteroidota bacterium]
MMTPAGLPDDPRVAILGAGSWGTALAISLARQGREVTLWVRRPEAAVSMDRERRNWHYLPKAVLPDSIRIISDLEEAVGGATVWVFATPSQSIRTLASRLEPHVHGGVVAVSVAKGIENGTLLTTSQVLRACLPSARPDHVGVLYGPSHAEEVGQDLATTVVAAFERLDVAEYVQELFMSPTLRVYVNTDLIGVEVGGSVKNVMAIAAGMSDGIGAGDNLKAALITRGLAEMSRLGRAMGARPETFAGLAGLGDLVVTCTSTHSRNRHLGEQLGRGRTMDEVAAEMTMVAEGVRTTQSVYELAKRLDVEMPITEAVHSILFEGKAPREALHELMTRTAKHEDFTAPIFQQEASE